LGITILLKFRQLLTNYFFSSPHREPAAFPLLNTALLNTWVSLLTCGPPARSTLDRTRSMGLESGHYKVRADLF